MALAPIFAGMRGTAALIASIAGLFAVKQLDQSVIGPGGATLVNDTQLFIPSTELVVNAQYIFLLYLDYEGAATGTGDLQIGWTLPAGATMRYMPIAYLTTGGAVGQGPGRTGSSNPAFGTNGAGVLEGVVMIGSLFLANNLGPIQLQWCQNTNNNSVATIVHAQSFLAMWRTS